jgi:membrane protease YdiL (CAAX protease family)
MKNKRIIFSIYFIFLLTFSVIFWNNIYSFLFPENMEDIFLSIFLGILFGFIGFLIAMFFYNRFEWARDNINQYDNEVKSKKIKKILISSSFTILEEFFYRGIIFSFFGFWASVLVFSLSHSIFLKRKITTFITISLWGIIFASLILLTNYLLASIICHLIATYLRIFFLKYLKKI